MMPTDVVELTEERDFLLRSLVDLDAELAAGDVDQHDYIALKDGYTARAAAVLRTLDKVAGAGAAGGGPHLASPPPREARAGAASRPDGAAPPPPRAAGGGVRSPVRARGPGAPGPKTRRRWVPTAVAGGVAVFAIGAGTLVANNAGQRLPGTTATGAITPTGPEAQLAQARQDLSDGKYLDAVKTYDAIVRSDPRNPEALAYRGWILRLTGKQAGDPSLIDRGLVSVLAAEAADPTYPDAHFFAGEILLRDKNQGAAAAAEFQHFLANSPPAAMVPEVQGELRAAQAVVTASPTTAAP